MFTFVFTLMMSVGNASQAACSLEHILTAAKPSKDCVAGFLSKIKNDRDQSEVKFRLSQWKPIKDLNVESKSGVIEAFGNNQVLVRAVLVQKQNPMLLWVNGQLLEDNSDNPSFTRRLDNALKKVRASNGSWLPEANAADISTVTNVSQDLVLFYALDDAQTWGDAKTVAEKQSDDLREFLPKQSFLNKLRARPTQMKCTADNTIESAEFGFDEYKPQGFSDRKLKITPRSETEFIVTGLKSKQTHVIRTSTWDATDKNKKFRVFSPKASMTGATISTCEDAACKVTRPAEPLEDWNLALGQNAQEKIAFTKNSTKHNREEFENLNLRYRQQLGKTLFGLSVLGDCCSNLKCHDLMKKTYAIQMQQAPLVESAESTTTH